MRASSSGITILLLALLMSACGPDGDGATTGPRAAASAEEALDSESYKKLRSRALRAFQRGDFEAAATAARSALALAPTARDPYDLLSTILIQAGEDDEAISLFRAVTEMHAGVAYPWFYKGYHEFRLSRWNEAGDSFDRAIELDPADAESRFRRAMIWHAVGDFDNAVKEFREAYALEPTALRAALLGRALRVVGEYDESERLILEALAQAPDSARLHYGLGQTRVRQRRDDEAEVELRRALELDPSMLEAQRDLAGLLKRSGRTEQARRAQRTVQRLDDYDLLHAFMIERLGILPDHPVVPLLLAELEMTERKMTSGMRWFARSETLRGPAARIAAGRAWVYFATGALEFGEKELARLEGYADGRTLLARAAKSLVGGETDEAVRLADEAIAAGPEEKDFLRRASDLLLQAGQEQRAEEVALRAEAAPFPKVPTTSLNVRGSGTLEEWPKPDETGTP